MGASEASRGSAQCSRSIEIILDKLPRHKILEVTRQSENDLFMKTLEERFTSIKKWTKHIDIFDKKFLIIPFNDKSNHHFIS